MKLAMKWFVLMVPLAFLSSCSERSPLDVEEYDHIPIFLEHQKIPGVSIAIIKDFAIDKVLFYGVSAAGSDQPVKADTLFQAGAISQAVTALAAMKIYQDQQLDPDSNINDQLKSWRLDAGVHASRQKATLRKLLSHTAGTNVPGYDGYPQGEALPGLRQILSNTGNSRPAGVIINSESGIYRYSAGGYSVVQQALVDITKSPFEALMLDNVLTPLAMQNSTFSQPLSTALSGGASAGHDSSGAILPGRFYNYPEKAASGMWSTASDLAKFVIELQRAANGQSRTGLEQETALELLQPVQMSYGLGLDIVNKGNSTYFNSGGTSKGFQAALQAHSSLGMGVVIMTNSDNGFQAIPKLMSLVAKKEQWPDY